MSAAIAARRVQEAHDVGAEFIVSSCANCEQTLGAPAGDVSPIPTIDLLEMVRASLV